MSVEILQSRQFVQDAVSLIKREANSAIRVRNEFRIALSGGNTPQPIFAALAKCTLHWSRMVITFSDERCVRPNDAQSNYFMASKALLNHVPIPAGNILRMKGEQDPTEAALEYELLLQRRAGHESTYRHDLLLLGVGADGHIASLFQETKALKVTDRLVIENYVPKLRAWRLTFTYPLINAARHVLFLVKSTTKDGILQQVFGEHSSSNLPCSYVLPKNGKLTWLLGSA